MIFFPRDPITLPLRIPSWCQKIFLPGPIQVPSSTLLCKKNFTKNPGWYVSLSEMSWSFNIYQTHTSRIPYCSRVPCSTEVKFLWPYVSISKFWADYFPICILQPFDTINPLNHFYVPPFCPDILTLCDASCSPNYIEIEPAIRGALNANEYKVAAN